MPIRKVNGGYKIENTPGVSATYQEAVKRLQAIKANQRKKRKERNAKEN